MGNCRVLQSGVCYITQPFHYAGSKGYTYYHGGIDLVDFSQGYSNLGYITAHSAGKVIGIETGYTGPVQDGSYGNYIWIMHGNGCSTLYAHLAYGTIRVKVGDWVSRGQIIAYMNNSGHSFGAHLHWEVRDTANNKIDPEKYLNADFPYVDGVWGSGSNWYYYKDGKIDYSYTGLAQNAKGWWWIQNGKVDFRKEDVVQNKYGWWYVKGGKVQFNYTGIRPNKYGWWRIVKGKVDFNCNSVEQNENGWFYIRKGKVDFGYTGIAQNRYGWWRIVKGKVDFSCNTVEQNENGWFKCKNGKVDFSFNGIGENKNGLWVCEKGKVNFGYNGEYKDPNTGVVYQVTNGKAVKKTTE